MKFHLHVQARTSVSNDTSSSKAAHEKSPMAKKAPSSDQKPLWRSYYELTRLHRFPAGTILFFWPCAWGLTLAAYRLNLHPNVLIYRTIVYFIGSTLPLHSAACILNDMCDRDFDRQVERCKGRPIASGAVSMSGAAVFLVFTTLPCIAMLAYTNGLAFWIGIFGLFPLHALYPLMKRWTYWPQAWLGFAMNWCLPVAWADVSGYIDWKLMSLYIVGTVCWTVVYDTIYALQDREDDVKAGVKSTALLFGDMVLPIISLFAAVFVSTLAYAGIVNGQGLWFYVISVGVTGLHLLWQLVTLDIHNPAHCSRMFKANGDVGGIIWAGMLVDYYVKDLA